MLKEYLKWVNEHDEVDESIFPMDSVHTGKPASKSVIGENFDIDGKRILIDFDQVIHKYSVGWLEGIIYDEPIKGAREAIKEFRNDGYEVIIFTSRLSKIAHGEDGIVKQKEMIEEWLKEHDIEVDGITGDKIPAEIYIDDRALRFEGKWDKYFCSSVISTINKNK